MGRKIKQTNVFKLISILVCFVFLFSPLQNIQAQNYNHAYPKIANMFLKWGISEEEAKELSQWDLVIIDMEAQTYTPENLKKLRQYNPDIIILAYITAQEIRIDAPQLKNTLRQKLFSGISDSWWLRNSQGQKLSWWQDTWLLNVSDDCPIVNGKRWNNYLPEFIHNEIMSSGLWDGIFYDNAWNDLGWFVPNRSVDINNDGREDTVAFINNKWHSGMEKMFQKSRSLEGYNKLFAGNGGSAYREVLNGSLLEHFPYTINNNWQNTLSEYLLVENQGQEPRINVINSNTNNTGNKNDYKKFRFGLASTLLGDGYYSFDYGDQDHSQLWWYDEYDAFLNNPASDCYHIDDSSNKEIKEGVWRRDFKEGLVLLNSSSVDREIKLKGEFEKIHGIQDTQVNDGRIVSKVVVPSKDGIILLRPVEQIMGATFLNASFASIFNQKGQKVRNGFFAYQSNLRGGQKIVIKDLDGNGSNEYVVADKNKVYIYSKDFNKIVEFYPYTKNYDKGINITVGDLDNDGSLEIITGTENGGGPHIRIFNRNGKLINPGFFAYGKGYRGGVNVAVGDLNGDGWNEIIAGAGVGGGPHVRVFNKDGKVINPGFFAYDPDFRGGVNVAVGDLNGDNIDEIITGPGYGGGPQVKVFDNNGKVLSAGFFAYDQNIRTGVKVAASDINGDGKDEIVALTTDVFTLSTAKFPLIRGNKGVLKKEIP